jgi:hypothetical protein
VDFFARTAENRPELKAARGELAVRTTDKLLLETLSVGGLTPFV